MAVIMAFSILAMTKESLEQKRLVDMDQLSNLLHTLGA